LKVNYDKTELFPTGTIRESFLPLYSRRNIRWSSTELCILGIYITHRKQQMINKNYEPAVTNLKTS